MKYVVVIGNSGKPIAIGTFHDFYGKWMEVRRNDNEIVAVNTDFVQSIHWMERPTQKMLELMMRSAPIADGAEEEIHPSPIAVKSVSGSTKSVSMDEVIQSLVENGPPEMKNEPDGAGIFALPSTVRLPDGVVLDEDNVLPGSKKRRKRGANDSK